jgi:hypothetical protein
MQTRLSRLKCICRDGDVKLGNGRLRFPGLSDVLAGRRRHPVAPTHSKPPQTSFLSYECDSRHSCALLDDIDTRTTPLSLCHLLLHRERRAIEGPPYRFRSLQDIRHGLVRLLYTRPGRPRCFSAPD